MITTLRTGALTLASVQYKFTADKMLTIKLITSGSHLLYGGVNIVLANVLDINVYNSNGGLVENFFNNTLSFNRTSPTTLEYSERINSGVAQSESFITLTNNGSPITATVANSSFTLERGNYEFLLIDSDTNFSTSKISIVSQDVGGTGQSGIESLFDKDGENDLLSINAVELQFPYQVLVSINGDVSGTTNIPLIINNR